jgi:predicted ester cyclase
VINPDTIKASLSSAASWTAFAAVAGGLLGVTAIAFCVILPDGVFALGCSLDRFFGSLRLSRVLTTLSLGGVCVLLARSSVRLAWVMGVLVVLLSLATLVWAVIGGPFELSPRWPVADVPELLLSLSVVALWGKPILMAFLGAGLLWAGRWFPASLLFVLAALEMPLLVVPLDSLARALDMEHAEWPVLLLGLWGPGLIGAAGWTLLGTVIFASGMELRERKRQAIAEGNLRKARRLYEEAFGASNLSVVDELVAEDFFDHHHNRRGPGEFKRTITDLRHTFPDLRLTVEEQTMEGDAVTTRCILSGTDRGGVLWYPPTGKRATFAGTYVDRFSNGRLVEHRGDTDMAGLLEQLGLPSGSGL